MTRREWLTQNPPPRAAKSIQQLLDGLEVQLAARNGQHTLEQQWTNYRNHWQTRVSDPLEGAIAQSNVATANKELATITEQLAQTADVPARCGQLRGELTHAAVCPFHKTQLFRNLNRPEDMFTCEVGPHHLLWTRINGKAVMLPLESLAVPSLDYGMTEGVEIPRAQWLASHPPLHVVCPLHGKEVIPHRAEDRVDVFRCQEAPDQILLWTADKTGQAALVVWKAGEALPELEAAV